MTVYIKYAHARTLTTTQARCHKQTKHHLKGRLSHEKVSCLVSINAQLISIFLCSLHVSIICLLFIFPQKMNEPFVCACNAATAADHACLICPVAVSPLIAPLKQLYITEIEKLMLKYCSEEENKKRAQSQQMPSSLVSINAMLFCIIL